MKLQDIFAWVLAYTFATSVESNVHQPKIIARGGGDYPVEKFVSSDVQAPHVNFLQWSPECNDGRYYFIAPRGHKVPHPGPMILDEGGSLIWSERFENDFGGQAYDLKVQKWHGKDHLTFWLGDDTVRGHGAGQFFMLDSSYNIVNKVDAGHGLFADLHDFVITHDDNGLLTIFEPVQADVRPAGRRFNDLWNQAIWDCVFQEVDLSTGQVLFEWRASEHVNLTDSYSKLDSIGDVGTQANPYDYFHLNSVEKDNRGNYLISARNTHAIYYIDGRSKKILWTLGGKKNDFQDLSQGSALNFAWQHDARFISEGSIPDLYQHTQPRSHQDTMLVTLFDNAAVDWDYSYGPPYSRGLLLELLTPGPDLRGQSQLPATLGTIKSDQKTRHELSDVDKQKLKSINGTDPSKTVRVIKEYIHPLRFNSSMQGSVRLLTEDDGQHYGHEHSKAPLFLVGYGINAVMTSFSSNGTALCDAHFAAKESWETGNVQSYRASKQKWVGYPTTAPSAVKSGKVIYVSWNGATQCREWLVEGSDDPSSQDWVDMIRVPKDGFETKITLDDVEDAPAYVRVAALDRNGRHLEHGISTPISRKDLISVISETTDTNPLIWKAFWFSGIAFALSLTWRFYRRNRGSGGQKASRTSLLPRLRND